MCIWLVTSISGRLLFFNWGTSNQTQRIWKHQVTENAFFRVGSVECCRWGGRWSQFASLQIWICGHHTHHDSDGETALFYSQLRSDSIFLLDLCRESSWQVLAAWWVASLYRNPVLMQKTWRKYWNCQQNKSITWVCCTQSMIKHHRCSYLVPKKCEKHDMNYFKIKNSKTWNVEATMAVGMLGANCWKSCDQSREQNQGREGSEKKGITLQWQWTWASES